MLERIQKVLAHSGVASRREIESMIVQGHVAVNGKVVTELGIKIDPSKDKVTVDGKRVQLKSDNMQHKVYFLLHKPPKAVTTTKKESSRTTVLDLVLGAAEGRIYPVGRLDFDASGALLLTNDGEFAHLLTNPKFQLEKTYMVKVKGVPSEEELDKLRRGIYLEDGPTGPCKIRVVEKARVNSWVEVVLTEGKNRQIKRMFWRIKHPVIRLIRTHFAGISIENMEEGQYRELSKRELAHLRKLTTR